MNIIEEATKRLEELGKAGVEPVQQPAAPATSAPAPEPIPQRVSRAAGAVPAGEAAPRAIRNLRAPQPPIGGAARGEHFRTIDFDRLKASGFITPIDPDLQLLHEFRVIKRPLLRNAFGKGAAPVKNGNLVMVTSSLPGEGKTFVAVNLALSIAMEIDSTVLLVDADVVAPSIPRLFGIQATKGFMDVLTERDVSIGDVLLRTNVERLAFLPAGGAHRRASELLASEAMSELLEEVANRYSDRVVIFDSPPLLATTEARSLASHMGQVVVVVEAERTTHGMLENALATVESCPIVLTMLNKSSASGGGSYYGYYSSGER